MKLFVLFSALMLVGCGAASEDSKQSAKTEALMSELNAEVGFPNLTNFQQKKLMKMIIEECDKEDLICYAYLKSDYTGKLIFVGQCLGYGVPFSAQFTNPSKVSGSHGHWKIMPQQDPNGLFMPASSSATWLILVGPKGNPRVAYFEPEIVVSPFPLHTESSK